MNITAFANAMMELRAKFPDATVMVHRDWDDPENVASYKTRHWLRHLDEESGNNVEVEISEAEYEALKFAIKMDETNLGKFELVSIVELLL